MNKNLCNKIYNITKNKIKFRMNHKTNYNIKWRQRIYYWFSRNQKGKTLNQKQNVFLFKEMITHHKFNQSFKSFKKKKKLNLPNKKRIVFIQKKNIPKV